MQLYDTMLKELSLCVTTNQTVFAQYIISTPVVVQVKVYDLSPHT